MLFSKNIQGRTPIWLFVVGYIVAYACIGLMFTLLYINAAPENITTNEGLVFSLSLGESMQISGDNVQYILICHRLLINILFAVFTGVLIYLLINKRPKLFFPDKLIVRKRDGELSDKKLTLSIMIGNMDRKPLYNVRCSVQYYYDTSNSPEFVIGNGGTCFENSIPRIKNYHRFSYELKGFPQSLHNELINPTHGSPNAVLVLITGRCGRFRNEFTANRTYDMPDIIIASGNTLPCKQKNECREVIDEKIKWSNLNDIRYYQDDKRSEIIQEIKSYITKKTDGE